MKTNYVYIYLDQRKPGQWIFEGEVFDFEPFYVGRGVKNRIEKHLWPSELEKSSHKNNKIKKIMEETGEIPFHFIVFQGLTRKESEEIEVRMIKHFGRVDLGTGPLTNKTDGGDGFNNISPEGEDILRRKRQGKRLTGKEFVGIVKIPSQYLTKIIIDGRPKSKSFPTEIEAAEAYDKMALFIYGPTANLNFPNKKELFLKEDLKSFSTFFLTHSNKHTQYKRIMVDPNHPLKWRVRVVKQDGGKVPKLKLGIFDSEYDAAVMADKVAFYFLNLPKEKLNFPEMNHDKDQLRIFFESKLRNPV